MPAVNVEMRDWAEGESLECLVVKLVSVGQAMLVMDKGKEVQAKRMMDKALNSRLPIET